MKNFILIVTTAFFFTITIDQSTTQGDLDLIAQLACIQECQDEATLCVAVLQAEWFECKWDCERNYPHDSDHGYYGDWCHTQCDIWLDWRAELCYSNLDFCLTYCIG